MQFAWRLSKAPRPQLCPEHKVVTNIAQHNAFVLEEVQKCEVQHILNQAFIDHGVSHEDLAFSMSPTAVWAIKKIKKGSLKQGQGWSQGWCGHHEGIWVFVADPALQAAHKFQCKW